jgi:hypothetical protein
MMPLAQDKITPQQAAPTGCGHNFAMANLAAQAELSHRIYIW